MKLSPELCWLVQGRGRIEARCPAPSPVLFLRPWGSEKSKMPGLRDTGGHILSLPQVAVG